MGTPAPDIFKQQRENNFTGTATLSVLDGEGIFGGEYKYVYYFFKKPPTFISSTNVVTLNLFGIPDKNIKEKVENKTQTLIDKLQDLFNKKTTTPLPFKPPKPTIPTIPTIPIPRKPTIPTPPLLPTLPTLLPTLPTPLTPPPGEGFPDRIPFYKGFGQFFVLDWDFLDESEREIDGNANTVYEVPGLALNSVAPSLLQVVNGIRLIVNQG